MTNRRDFLTYATIGTGIVTVTAACAGLVQTLAPLPEAVLTHDVDLARIEPGEEFRFLFNNVPMVILHRTAEDIASARAAKQSDLFDPMARNANLLYDTAASDINRSATPDGRFVLLEAVCTRRFRCAVMEFPMGDYGGWFCPCCGTHYDTSGRVRWGPAPRNMAVPAFELTSPETIRVRSSPVLKPDRYHHLIWG